MAVTADRALSAPDFYAESRPAGLFTTLISQRLGAYLASGAHRTRLSPTMLTLANLVLGLAAAAFVTTTAGPVAAGWLPAWPAGVVAFVAWQLGYALDCADGQLARATGTGSPAGARVDILSDVAIQIAIVAAIGEVAVAQRSSTPVWLAGAFAGTWMINLVTSVMDKQGTNDSLVRSASLAVRVVKLIRDYGAIITLICVVLAIVPSWTVWLLVLFTAVNGLFLLASIAAAARASIRR